MAELKITFLKSEFCRFEENYKDLKVRVKITDVWNISEDNIFTAKIITDITDPENTDSKLEYPLITWTETIIETTTKLIKEYDLNLVTFLDGRLPLNIGTHTLEVNINNTTTSEEFDVVPLTVQSIKNQYLLGIELESKTELVFQQDLRLITGVEVLQISKDTPVGPKELIWDATAKTLQWDNGEPVVISDAYLEYHLLNYMGSAAGITDGDYIQVKIEDIEDMPSENQTELVIVDTKNYKLEDYQYFINNAYRVLTETIIMTDIEPTLYSSDKSLDYKYLDPVMDIPKSFSESSNYSFEFAVNMLQEIVELWAQYFGSDAKISIDNSVITFSTDGQIVIRGYPYNTGRSGAVGGNTAVIGLAGYWDRTIYAKTHAGARNKTKNFWNGTVLAGIREKNLRNLALDIIAKLATGDLYIQAGLGSGAGVASRSFSVGGISSATTSVESAENSKYSSSILEIQRRLGIGKSTKDEQKAGLINQIRNKILGGSMSFKY